MHKITVNIDDELYEQIEAYSFSSNMNSLSDAFRSLLTKGLLSINESNYAPLIRNQVKEELDSFIYKIESRLLQSADDVLAELDSKLSDQISDCRRTSLAGLFATSILARPHDAEGYAEEAFNRSLIAELPIDDENNYFEDELYEDLNALDDDL